MRYNSMVEMKRGFSIGGAGCCPTALAIVLRAVLTPEELLALQALSYQGAGYGFCICSNVPRYCTNMHERFIPETAEEFAHFLPIILSSYLGGNNSGRQIGNSLSRPLLAKLGIEYEYVLNYELALEALENGAIIFSNTGTTMSPFTETGHYIVLASLYEDYIYVLDPYVRDTYEKFDKNGVLEIITPGLVRAKVENVKKLRISGYLIVYPNRGANADALPQGSN